jgi:hypothetical protein
MLRSVIAELDLRKRALGDATQWIGLSLVAVRFDAGLARSDGLGVWLVGSDVESWIQ